jgi:broad specificity phosphatase PhoE
MEYYCQIMLDAVKTLVLIRHGQTDWNNERRFQGQLDVPMNAFGRRQAIAARSYLAGAAFDRVYSSPLQRAFETAQMISGVGRIVKDSRLSEIHHGCWQGRTQREIALRWPHQWERWREHPHFTPSDGEPTNSVRSRVEDFLCSVRGANILCVSHGVIIQTLLWILSGSLNSQGEMPPNASIHTLSFRNKKLCEYRVEVPVGQDI